MSGTVINHKKELCFFQIREQKTSICKAEKVGIHVILYFLPYSKSIFYTESLSVIATRPLPISSNALEKSQIR